MTIIPERLYHIISTNDKTGVNLRLTAWPMTHKECMTMKSKITDYPGRTVHLVECVE